MLGEVVALRKQSAPGATTTPGVYGRCVTMDTGFSGPPGAAELETAGDEPFDPGDFAPFPRRTRRGRGVLGVIVAVALVVATTGSVVGFLLGGSSGAGSIATSSVSVTAYAAADGQRVTRGRVNEAGVSFVVSNTTSRAVRPECTVVVTRGGGATVGTVTGNLPNPVGAGEAARVHVQVPLTAVVDLGPGSTLAGRATCAA